MRGTEFIQSLPPGDDGPSRGARAAAVLDAVRGGLALPIAWMPVAASAGGHEATIFVASDTLRFGEDGPNDRPDDWDWVRVAVTAATAQQIADLLGVLLPTDRIADLTHAQATVHLSPHTQTPVTATTAAMLKHHAQIEGERAGRTGLCSTVGKEWILGVQLFPAAAPRHPLGKLGAINYGWHTVGPARQDGPFAGRGGLILWQTPGFRHDIAHVDYSQWVPRLVHPRMIVDGGEVATADVLGSAELAALVSYDGPLEGVRYPAVAPLAACSDPGPLPAITAPAAVA
jgi:hypothetical protein